MRGRTAAMILVTLMGLALGLAGVRHHARVARARGSRLVGPIEQSDLTDLVHLMGGSVREGGK